MRLKTITVQGFKCFNKPVTFDFDREPGLYYLTGENQVEPSLGANGVGKSSLYDAWTFLFFGKTARGLKAGDIYSWKSKILCKTEGVFYLGPQEYTLKRTWNPNTLELKKGEDSFEEVTQEQVERLIEFSFEGWLSSVLMDQQGEKFMDRSPTEKTAMFSSILGLDYWLECSKRASEKAAFLWDILRDTESLESKLEGQLEEAEKREFDDDIKKWEKERKSRVDLLKSEMIKARKEAESLQKEIESLTEKEVEIAKSLEESQEALELKVDKKKDLDEKIVRAKTKIEGLEDAIYDLKKKLKKWDGLEPGGECPYCNQFIETEHKEKEVAGIEKEIAEIKEQIQEKEDLIEKTKKVAAKVKAKIVLLKDEVVEITSTKEKVLVKKSSKESEARSIMKAAIRNRTEYQRISEEENPYLVAKRDHERHLKSIKASLEEQRKDVINTRAKHDAARFWVKGFKELRFHLIKEALLQFEIEVNSSLQSLGLGDWKMEFSMDEETKSGTIKKGFCVTVKSPHNKEKVKWEAWSGGESQRLRVSASMGLINLILSRRSYDTNIEIWDEPTQYLSEKGVYDLLDTIKNRAEGLGKQIWIVDHRTLCYSNFKKSFKMIKSKEGSSMEEFI